MIFLHSDLRLHIRVHADHMETDLYARLNACIPHLRILGLRGRIPVVNSAHGRTAEPPVDTLRHPLVERTSHNASLKPEKFLHQPAGSKHQHSAHEHPQGNAKNGR
ncbi:uncharacterized protein METZ01_LOCUS334239, partial [marine metagenome]